MANTLKLYISPENQRLLAGPTAFNAAPPPVFFSGNTVNLELHAYDGVGIARLPFETPFPSGAAVKVAIGTVAVRPTSGQWRLSVSSTETTDLAFDATPAQVQTALNALSAVSTAGGVTVATLGDGYSITWNTVGTKPDILAGTDTLVPASYESILILQEGTLTDRKIVFTELRQSPVALAENFVAMSAPVVTADTVSAWNGNNKVVRFSIDPEPKGGFYSITFNGKTAIINAITGDASFRTALTSASITEFSSVTQTGQFQYDVAFTANFTPTVNGSGLIASMGIVGELDLSTSELLAYLGSESSKTATLEITMTSAGEERTICQVPCSVANGVVSPGAVSPLVIGTLLTESVANARYIRRDAAQTPGSTDLDIIWPNLGVSLDGSDVAAALSASNAPASGNAFATIADLPAPPDLSAYLTITSAAATYQTQAGMSAYLTTASASSIYQTQAGMSSYLTTASASSTYQTISGMSSYLTTASAASTYLTQANAASTYALLSSFNQGVKTTDAPEFATVYFGDNPFSRIVITPTEITFPDLTTQTSAPVVSTGTTQHGGSGGTIHEGNYPNEIHIVIGGITYGMPARVI